MRNQRFRQVITRVRSSFNGFTAGQRAVTIVAIVVAIVGGMLFVRWATQPQLDPLFSQLSAADASAVTTSLTDKGIPNEFKDNTVYVPRNLKDQARMDLAAENLPAGDNSKEGYPLVENAPLTTSDSQQRILIKRATEGELKKAIQQIEAVQTATVNRALPDPDVFTRDQAPPKASVIIAPKPNGSLTSGQVEAIVHLVSSSIPKLDPTNVTVADSKGALLSAQGAAGGGAVGEARVAQQAAYSAQVNQSLQGLLDTTVGPGNSSVSVRADMDFSNTKTWRNTYIQPPAGAPALASDTTKELYKGNGQTPVGGVLGPDNIPVPSANAGTNGSDWEKTSTKETQPYGTESQYVDGTAGQIKRLNVAVLLDAKNTGAVQLGVIQQAVCSAAGVDTKRGDVCTVAKTPFDTVAAKKAADEAAALAAQARQDELMSLAKNVGLGLLLLLALLIGFRQSRKRTRTLELGQLESTERPIRPELPGAAAIEGRPAEFELDSDDDLRVLQATPIDPQSQARVAARDEIATLVQDNPDEVARLLRGWMIERS
ncbi:MAG: flagellar basal-body MS-ring/collar protein FliF [Micrococcales bacterium]|nr:flagellar basal-body MS-ring/collar protein FliF [Micrococcales bacterium]